GRGDPRDALTPLRPPGGDGNGDGQRDDDGGGHCDGHAMNASAAGLVAAAATHAPAVPAEFAQALVALGLADAGETLTGEPLAGGVSSDIWRIDTGRGPVCAKRALAKLRVAADWQAPVDRNRYEARWLAVANAAQPGSAPRLLGRHAELGVLVMSWLAPAGHRLWKQSLRDGDVDA